MERGQRPGTESGPSVLEQGHLRKSPPRGSSTMSREEDLGKALEEEESSVVHSGFQSRVVCKDWVVGCSLELIRQWAHV